MVTNNFKLPPLIIETLESVYNVHDTNVYTRYFLTKAVLGYVLRIYDFNEMYSYVNGFIDRKTAQHIRKKCMERYELTVNLKNVIYSLLEDGINDKERVRKRFEISGLSKKDARLFFWLHDLEIHDDLTQKMKTAVEHFERPEIVRQKCFKALSALDDEDYIIKFVRRKFHFIIEHNNISEYDIANTLTIAAISSFYHDYPFKEEAHLYNVMKQSLHNVGINIIEEFTSAKRSRLTNQDGKFIATNSSIVSTNESGEEYDTKTIKPHELTHEEDNMVLRISFETILKQYKGKSKTVIKLLSGYEIQGFLEFINRTERKHFNSVEHFNQHVSNEKYLAKIKEYTGINDAKMNGIIKELQKQLK